MPEWNYEQKGSEAEVRKKKRRLVLFRVQVGAFHFLFLFIIFLVRSQNGLLKKGITRLFGWTAGKHFQPPYTFFSEHPGSTQRLTRSTSATETRDCAICGKNYDEHLEVKETNIGRSIFAAQQFGKGTIVCEYQGTFVPAANLKDKTLEAERIANCFLFEFVFEGHMCAIDAFPENKTKGRLINHSKRGANVAPFLHIHEDIPRIFFKAIREINRGEEIFYDYKDKQKSSLETFSWLRE